MRARLRRTIDAAGAAGGLALSVGIIGVVVWTGAAGADWDGSTQAAAPCPTTSSSGLPPSMSSNPPSSVVPSSPPPTTISPAPSSQPSSSAPPSCEPSATSSRTSGTGNATTTRSKPRPTTTPREDDHITSRPTTPTTPTTTPTTPRANANGQPVTPVQPGPTVPGGEVPNAGPLPGDGQLPQDAAPPVATQVPDFGLLGPDPKALTKQQEMSPGEARALPDQQEARSAELIAVGLLAIVVGVLARTLAPRPGKRKG